MRPSPIAIYLRAPWARRRSRASPSTCLWSRCRAARPRGPRRARVPACRRRTKLKKPNAEPSEEEDPTWSSTWS